MDEWATAAEIPSAVGEDRATAAVTADRALATARKVAAALVGGGPVPPLAGVPFAVKNLFDVAGLPTLAGSKINRDHARAAADSPLIARPKPPVQCWSAR